MKIYLMRHGETDWNVAGKMQGRKDIPMNSNGVEQITELAERLRGMDFCVDMIISSPLDRARKSAEIVAEKIGFTGNIIYDDDFIERSFGEAEGLVWTPELHLSDPKYNAESVEELCARAEKALHKYQSEEDKNILIVAHGAILAATKSVLSQGKWGYFDKSVPIIQGNVLCCEVHGEGERSFYNLF